MRSDDKRKQLPRRWGSMADYHRQAASLCQAIAKAKALGQPSQALRLRLRALERRGGDHRNRLLWADPEAL